MRTIKFRCWDEDNEVMYYSDKEDDDCIFAFEKGEVIAFLKHIVPATLDEPPYQIGRPCTNIMQFTGLLDKNGKEIWEGDIVNFGCSTNWEIWFDRGFFQVRNKGGISGWHGIWNYAPDEIEVIGNVMENPELLEKEG